MPPLSPAATPSRFRPEAWRIAVWIVLLLAVFGILQYSMHAWRVAGMLRRVEGDAQGALAGMLAWDIVYLVVACVTVTASAGTLLYRRWARPVLRVLAAGLALWLLVTAVMMALHWGNLDGSDAAFAGLGDAGQALLARMRRSYLVAIILKAIGVGVLAWLAWRLGVPAVRAGFARRRGE